MGRKGSEKGPRRAAGKRASRPRATRGSEAAPNRADRGAGASGSSRLLLTRLLREGGIWDVYIATTAQAGTPNLTRLEFEGRGPERKNLRYSRPVESTILNALHSGGSVSRARLDEELEVAIREAEAADRAGAPVPGNP